MSTPSEAVLRAPPRVLAHGYALNHTALSIHRLEGLPEASPAAVSAAPTAAIGRWSLSEFSDTVAASGVSLNKEGSIVKVGCLRGGVSGRVVSGSIHRESDSKYM